MLERHPGHLGPRLLGTSGAAPLPLAGGPTTGTRWRRELLVHCWSPIKAEEVDSVARLTYKVYQALRVEYVIKFCFLISKTGQFTQKEVFQDPSLLLRAPRKVLAQELAGADGGPRRARAPDPAGGATQNQGRSPGALVPKDPPCPLESMRAPTFGALD